MPDAKSWAHLVGSVPLPDAETVFRTVSGAWGPHLRRISDGETGRRGRWIWFQREMLERHPAMEPDPDEPPYALYQWDGQLLRETPYMRFRPGVDPAKVDFPTGYAEAALESFDLYAGLQDAGVIPGDARFQVSLPTPMATAYMYVSPSARDAYLPAYERSLLSAVDEILASAPNDRLSIQWDVCQEVLLFEDYFPHRPADYRAQVFAELGRLGDAIPEAVDLGYHLCYGSPRDEHLVMPRDMGILVEIANGIGDRLDRRLDFVHMPVPQDRTDREYFAQLDGLRLPGETELILGLVHHDDTAGDRARIDAARTFVGSFGVASECGWGRTDPARVPGLLDSHRRAVEYINAG
ncbi:MAG: hypothetical protein OXF79_05010 [Chloroflexi bacterium]|nr:hypothetical protein [Chloroflexota bacterium]